MEEKLQEELKAIKEQFWMSVAIGQLEREGFDILLIRLEKAQGALDKFYAGHALEHIIAIAAMQMDVSKKQQDTIDLLIKEITQ